MQILLENASSGRPIITTNNPGCYETVNEGITGYIYEKGNVGELVNKIENKDTFILQFTKTTCPFCKDLEKIENEYFLNNDEIIFRFFTDLNEKDYNENLNFF